MMKPPERLCKRCGACCLNINCESLQADNSCAIYEHRPEECRCFPFNIWNDVPEGCGYKGWIFLLREKEKQKVRFEKEKILSILVKMKGATLQQKALLKNEISEIENFIKTYEQYGSKDW